MQQQDLIDLGLSAEQATAVLALEAAEQPPVVTEQPPVVTEPAPVVTEPAPSIDPARLAKVEAGLSDLAAKVDACRRRMGL